MSTQTRNHAKLYEFWNVSAVAGQSLFIKRPKPQITANAGAASGETWRILEYLRFLADGPHEWKVSTGNQRKAKMERDKDGSCLKVEPVLDREKEFWWLLDDQIEISFDKVSELQHIWDRQFAKLMPSHLEYCSLCQTPNVYNRMRLKLYRKFKKHWMHKMQ